jgi:hypothetical protein
VGQRDGLQRLAVEYALLLRGQAGVERGLTGGRKAVVEARASGQDSPWQALSGMDAGGVLAASSSVRSGSSGALVRITCTASSASWRPGFWRPGRRLVDAAGRWP